MWSISTDQIKHNFYAQVDIMLHPKLMSTPNLDLWFFNVVKVKQIKKDGVHNYHLFAEDSNCWLTNSVAYSASPLGRLIDIPASKYWQLRF